MDEWVDRLRVAMFTNVYLPNTNGVVVSVESFRKALTRLGHHAYVFAPDSGKIEQRAPYVFRYPAVELPLQKYPLTLPVSPYADHLLLNLKPQVLHANHPALLGRVAQRKSEELDLPLVFTYHTRYTDYAHYASPLPAENVKDFIHAWLGEFMSHCHHLVVPSQSIGNLLRQHYDIAGEISVVPTGIELEKFAQLERAQARKQLGWPLEDLVLISVGRLAKEKNFDLLLRAFALVQDDPQLYVLGAGEELKALQNLAQELGILERCHFTGLVAMSDIPTYLAAADLFVFASVTETQGLVTLEAMASGLGVAAVDGSGTRDAVSAECAVLCPPQPEALAEAIVQMLQRGDCSQAARSRAGQFDLLSQGQKLVEVYGQAIEAHRRGHRVLASTAESQSRWQSLLKLVGMSL
ncbi:glycosyltransferase [bacterium]|nr:glycosyltransferase [bacterium]